MTIIQDSALQNVRNFFESSPLRPGNLALKFVEYHSPIYRCEFAVFVRARGFGENVLLVDSLVPSVFDKLDALLARNRRLR